MSLPPPAATPQRSASHGASADVAEDLTLTVFDGVLGNDQVMNYIVENGSEDVVALRSRIEDIQAELEGAKNDLEFASLKEDELESRHDATKRKLAAKEQQLEQVTSELAESRSKQQEAELELSKLRDARAELEAVVKSGRQNVDETVKDECRALRETVSQLRYELANAKANEADQAQRLQQASDMQPEPEKSASADAPMLSAAYQQISVLNTQLAHLYTELTLARSETQQLKAQQQTSPPSASGSTGAAGVGAGPGAPAGEDVRDAQIADLVRDIRHLQLDLEYHQQKLDQMIDERQTMTKDLKRAQGETLRLKQQLEERCELLRHREVDIAHMRQVQQQQQPQPGTPGVSTTNATPEGALVALRAEASAKDSALIVSHYELHKEKLIREKLEAKNLKLMERMQKLMMIVETMRKDNVSLERSLAARERSYEDKELQLRQVMSKAKQLQRVVKTSGATRPARHSQGSTSFELEGTASQVDRSRSDHIGSLPPLRSPSAGGGRSANSTPRATPRTGGSPYTTR